MALRIKVLHHDHIDGSAAVRDVWDDLNRLSNKKSRFATHQELRDFFKDVHNDLLGKFEAITELLQNVEALEMLGYAYGRRRAKEGYTYVEAKFAPQYSLREGLTPRVVTHAMCKGLWRAESDFGIRILPHLCIGREAEPEVGESLARIALEYDGRIALDLACTEPGNPPERHLPAYKLTFGSKVMRDCHAGEWLDRREGESPLGYRARLLENVRTAVRVLKCHGVSHAIPLIDDPDLVSEMIDNGVRVAMCPLSNLTLGGITDVRELGIDKLLDTGLILTINPDDDVFLPSMEETIAACERAYDFTEEQRVLLESNPYRGAFAHDVRY